VGCSIDLLFVAVDERLKNASDVGANGGSRRRPDGLEKSGENRAKGERKRH
jgi:hypothetical protein